MRTKDVGGALGEEPIRVLIVDDHPLYRDGLEQLLSADGRFAVVASVGTGEAAVTSAEAHQPDVVVMDLQLPGLDGIEATRRIVTASPHIVVLVLTMFEDDDSVFAAMRAGARGYLVKGAEHAAIRRAVEAVGHGDTILGPAVAQRVLLHFGQLPATTASAPFPQLTDGEREVLDLVARGLGNQEIAHRLSISPSHRTKSRISSRSCRSPIAPTRLWPPARPALEPTDVHVDEAPWRGGTRSPAVPGYLSGGLPGLPDDPHGPFSEVGVVLPPCLWHGVSS